MTRMSLVVALVVLSACAGLQQGGGVQSADQRDPEHPQCLRPGNLILTPIDIKTATTELGSVKIGAVEYKATPTLERVLSESGNNPLVAEYLLCKAIARGEVKGDDAAEVQRRREYLNFMQTGPTPAEQIEWLKARNSAR